MGIDTDTGRPRRHLAIIALVLLLVGVAVYAVVSATVRATDAGDENVDLGAHALASLERSRTVLSDTLTIDQRYRSMMGPWTQTEVVLGAADGSAKHGSVEERDDHLLWITGYRAVMVAADGHTEMPDELMCHSNLDLDSEQHHRDLGTDLAFSPRLFTLSQGQLEVDFPSGFGIPVRADEPLILASQVLNHSIDGEPFDVRQRVRIDYLDEADADAARIRSAMRPLMPIAAYGLALLDGESGHYGVAQPDEEMHGPGCLVAEPASEHDYRDEQGRRFTGHWQVPPGRQVNRTLVTYLLQVPFASTVHYIAVHLHPFAESLELRDLTSGETLFRSEAKNFDDRIGLVHVDRFASTEGLPIYPDHEYELVSVYDNTSDEMQDSMAVMYIYLLDVELERRLDGQVLDG